MGSRRSLLLVLVAGISFGIMGCNGYEAAKAIDVGSSGLGDGKVDTEVNMEALNKDLGDVELSVTDIEAEMGKIDIPYLSAGDTTGVSQGLDKSMRKMFEKLLLAAQGAFDKVSVLRTEVNSRIAKLDPSNPLHMLALVKLNEVLAYLDQLEARLGDTYRELVGKIEGLVTSIDEKISKMDSKSPLTWAVMIYWQKIKLVVLEYRDKLLAVAP